MHYKHIYEKFNKFLLKEMHTKHTKSLMVALVVPENAVEKIKKLHIDVPQEDLLEDTLHVTLLYLGENNSEKYDKILSILQKICKHQNNLKASIGGFGEFNEGENGIPIYATIDCKGLNILQSKIETALKNFVQSASEHGYFPHCSLSYTKDKNYKLPILNGSDISWDVNGLCLVLGDDYKEIKFGS